MMPDRDSSLSDVLRKWRHEPTPAPRFNAQVWARIEATRDAPWSAAAFLASRLGIPALQFRWILPLAASLALAFAVLVGAGAGAIQGHQSRDDRMAAAYVRTIDPLQMAEGHP